MKIVLSVRLLNTIKICTIYFVNGYVLFKLCFRKHCVVQSEFLFYCSVELTTYRMYYILSHIPSLEGMDEKADYEMWNGLGDSPLLFDIYASNAHSIF